MEQRVAKLEKIVSRLMRREQKVAKAIIPPIPIGMAKSGDNVQGEIFSYMFPCNGTIAKAGIRLMEKPKGSVVVRVDLFDGVLGEQREFTVENKLTAIDLDVSVKAWDCLKVSVLANPEHPVTRIWATLLFRPEVKDSEAVNFILDEIDKVSKI
jgi:hypothetical protein